MFKQKKTQQGSSCNCRQFVKGVFSLICFCIWLIFISWLEVFADITDFSSSEYLSLVTEYDISEAHNQSWYLATMVTWSWTKKLDLPEDDDEPFTLNLESLDSLALQALDLQIYVYLDLTEDGFVYLDTMANHMQTADNWWIWYLSECVWDINKKFTTRETEGAWWVFCSNSKFFAKMYETKYVLLLKRDLLVKLQKDIQFLLENLTTVKVQTKIVSHGKWDYLVLDSVIPWRCGPVDGQIYWFKPRSKQCNTWALDWVDDVGLDAVLDGIVCD